MQPNKVLSKSMHVKPLRENEVVIYRLLSAEQDSPTHTDMEGQKLKNKPSWKASRQCLVYDIDTGEKKMIGNVTSVRPEKMPDGTIRYVDVTEPVKFVDGYLRLTKNEFNMYQYMERHDANQDNPFRDQNKTPRFFRVDPKKKATVENNKKLILGEALTWIGTADHTEVKAINKELPDGLKLNMDDDFEVIKSKLYDLTIQDPIMVMKASNNKSAIAKIVVMECEKFQIILWNEEDRVWFFNNEEMEQIASIEIGKNRVDALVDYFKTEKGKNMFVRLNTRLKKFLKQGAPE